MNLSRSEQETYNELLSSGMVKQEIFDQYLDMDDDTDTREFTFGLVEDFFIQALMKFPEMSDCLTNTSQSKSSRLTILYEAAHYLKGSSSTIGLLALPNTFETICEVTDVRPDPPGSPPRTRAPEDERLSKCGPLLQKAREEFEEVRPLLMRFYGGKKRFDSEATRDVPT